MRLLEAFLLLIFELPGLTNRFIIELIVNSMEGRVILDKSAGAGRQGATLTIFVALYSFPLLSLRSWGGQSLGFAC